MSFICNCDKLNFVLNTLKTSRGIINDEIYSYKSELRIKKEEFFDKFNKEEGLVSGCAEKTRLLELSIESTSFLISVLEIESEKIDKSILILEEMEGENV